MPEVDEVPVGLAEMGLDASKAKNNIRVALARDVLTCVERLFERDAHPSFEENGKVLLLANHLQKLEVLRVACADLQHHACRVPRVVERRTDLVDVTWIGDLHRDHLDAVLTGKLEHPWQASFAEPLEVIGV